MIGFSFIYRFINSGIQTFREPYAALSRPFATAAKHAHPYLQMSLGYWKPCMGFRTTPIWPMMHHSNLVVLLSSLIRPNVFKTTKDRCIQNIKSMRNCLGLVGMFLILRSADVLKPCGGSSQTWDNSIWLCFATLHNPPGWRPNCLLHSFLYLHEDWVYGFDQNLGKPQIIGIPVTQCPRNRSVRGFWRYLQNPQILAVLQNNMKSYFCRWALSSREVSWFWPDSINSLAGVAPFWH
jgi:hypothetical protein